MKRNLILVAALLSCAFPAFADERAPSPKACRAFRAWANGDEPAKICKTGGSADCAARAKNKGQAICLAAGGEGCDKVLNTGMGICQSMKGSSCDTVRNLAQGICYAMNGDICGGLEYTDGDEWKGKLIDACSGKLPPPSTKKARPVTKPEPANG